MSIHLPFPPNADDSPIQFLVKVQSVLERQRSVQTVSHIILCLSAELMPDHGVANQEDIGGLRRNGVAGLKRCRQGKYCIGGRHHFVSLSSLDTSSYFPFTYTMQC